MGRKHSRQRKFFFLYLACWLSVSLAGAGCSPLHQPYNEEQLPFWQSGEAEQLLLRAKSFFDRGDFLTSIKENQKILNRFPLSYGDHALYAMGLIYAHPEYRYANYDISMHFFNRLIKEYPESGFKNQSKIWVFLLNQTMENVTEIDQKNEQIALLKNELKLKKDQIQNLLNQIKRLKEIDLGIEEKKREVIPKIGE